MKTTIEVVGYLNDLVYNNLGECYYSFFYIKSNHIEGISLDINIDNSHTEIQLWNSENSQQRWNEKTSEYEPLEKTIIREYKLIIEEMLKIKKILK